MVSQQVSWIMLLQILQLIHQSNKIIISGANTVGGYDKLVIKYGYTIGNEKQGIEQQVLKTLQNRRRSRYHLLQMVIRKSKTHWHADTI